MTDAVVLDQCQKRVVEADPEDRRIVSAGPGAGKTEVIGHLVQHLIRDGLAPDEILIVSFSRAAVEVLRRRTAAFTEIGHGVEASTIDSLAARIVDELEGTDGFRGFDHVVRMAIDLLEKSDDSPLDHVRHMVVDEVQDLVGLRATFIISILSSIVGNGAGFTLLGDPLQAIYDFQTADDPTTPARFLDEVRSDYHPAEYRLDGEYRTESRDARSAIRSRDELLKLDSASRLRRLRGLVSDVPPLGTLDQDAADDIAAWSGRTALLCDTNIRAALAADRMTELGLVVEVSAGSEDCSLASWISLLIENGPANMSRDDFLDVAEAAQLQAPEQSWRLLIRLSGGRRQLQLRALGEVLGSNRASRELERDLETDVVASTVHRAKGLEFDNVVLVDHGEWEHPEQDDQASRRLFVALTRSRKRLTSLRGVDARGWGRRHGADGSMAWMHRLPRRGGRGPVTAILLEPWMARALGPRPASDTAVIGTGLTWHADEGHITVDGDCVPAWTALADGVPVARTGETFGIFINETYNARTRRPPALLGGRVAGSETVTGPARLDGPGRFGFWTGVRVAGPLTLVWNDQSAGQTGAHLQ